MIKYLGSKRMLLPAIVGMIRELPDVRTIIDLFSGTSRVGHALKQAGYFVTANDLNAYAHTLARCYVQADRQLYLKRATQLVQELKQVPPRPGYFTATFCEQARFFHPRNGERIDAIRTAIARTSLDPILESILLVSLMEAADRVDSTTGVQMAYLKSWAKRAERNLELRVPELVDGPGLAYRADAVDIAPTLCADLAYLDPPYNQHAYLGNYHAWESLISWDKPETFGVARKRIDCRERKSVFNSRRTIVQALENIIDSLNVRHLLVSFSNEGFVSRQSITELLAKRGDVRVFEIPHGRYVGAKIGIYNPSGEKVGRISHTTNVEYLFHVRCTKPAVQRRTRPALVQASGTTQMAVKHATLLIAHGSSDPEWRRPLDAVLQRLRMLAPGERHELAFLSRTPPNPMETIDAFYNDGVRSLTVVMALMSGGGGHFKIDLPEIVEEARKKYSDLQIEVMPEPLGAQPEVTDALARACLRWAAGTRTY
jgi:adenine-specific DNA-methyltransferase